MQLLRSRKEQTTQVMTLNIASIFVNLCHNRCRFGEIGILHVGGSIARALKVLCQSLIWAKFFLREYRK
jgi:hypothetical protein